SLTEEAPETAAGERERLPDSLAQLILDLRLEKVRRVLYEVQLRFREAEDRDDDDEKYVDALIEQLQRINKARWSMSATSRRQAEEADDS
ncbi:MAG: hypothetical protein R3248_03800, partial [Candidatus Promineifilaceae bacterium]|nr:hypothetical protein [Candidatus Promineifilaceae bacterium]